MSGRASTLALLGLVALALVTALVAAGAQQGRVPTIGVLAPGAPGTYPTLNAFLQGLRDLGYVEKQNIVIEYRWAENRYDRLPNLAAELTRLNVDVILAVAGPATEAAKNAASTVPIVFVVVGDPLGSGFVRSLARPGGNVTGLTSIAPEVIAKQLELLKGILPKLSRVAAIENPSSLHRRIQARHANDAARALGLQLQILEVLSPGDLDAAFVTLIRERAEALLVLADVMFFQHRTQIARLAATHRLPVVSGLREEAEAGGLIAYGASRRDLYRRAATYVDKILRGAKPADLPVEQPTTFELVINLKTAKALGLTIPPSLLLRADHVIE